MKKAIPMFVVLAVVAAAVAFLISRKQGASLDLAPGRAAEIAPGDAILYFELPNIERTGTRWKSTALHAISEEPEWKQFVAKWDDFKLQNDVAKSVFGVVADIEKADPAGLFVAVTSVEGLSPKVVGGFPYRGKKSDVEGVIRQLREQLLKAYPAAKSDIAKHDGTEIETLTDKNFTAAMAFRDNWFFFGTDLTLMQQTLSRHAGKQDALPGLAKDPLYQETLKSGIAEPDAVMWVRWTVFAEKMNALTGVLGGPPTPAVKDPNPVQAFLYTGKLDGALMREKVFIQVKEAQKTGSFANRSVGFTQAATYAYLVSDYSGMEDQMKAGLGGLEALGVLAELKTALETKGLKVADIFTTFGAEVAAMSAWEAGAVFPDVFVATEVRDAAKARLFAELIAEKMSSEGKLAKSDAEGTTIWALTVGDIPLIQPTIAVNEKHIMFGLNSGVVKAALTQLKTNGANLASKPGSQYPAALKTVPQPTGGLFYVDAKVLFERLYEKAKPFIAFQMLGEPELAKHFDAGKLPQAETISKHLSPIIVSIGRTEHGWSVESTGTISVIGSYGMIFPAAFLASSRMTAPAPVPPTPLPPPVAPAGAPAKPIDPAGSKSEAPPR